MTIESFIEKEAEDDPRYAIAYALLRVAGALERLGTANAATPMGALEFVGVKLEEIAGALGKIADALGDT